MVRNFVHLALLRGINMLSPFVLYPYLTRTVGMENFGYITVAFAVSTLLLTVGDYGFQQAAIRETAANRSNYQRITDLYWTITIVKPILVILTALLLFCGTSLYNADWRITVLYFSGTLLALSESSMPVWFFQGIEKMENLVYTNLIVRLLGVLLVFVCVKMETDFYLTMPMLGVGALAGTLFSHLVLVPRQRIVGAYSNARINVREMIVAGYPFFLRSVAVSFYALIPVFFLSKCASPEVVGHFGVADRIVAMIKAGLAAFSVAIFPPLVAMKPEGHANIVRYINKYFKPYLVLVILGSLMLFVFAEPIIRLYAGVEPGPIAPALRAMAFLPVSLALAQPTDALMQVYGREKLLSTLMIAVGIFNFFINFYLIPQHLAYGAALSLFLTETLLFFLFLWYFERKYPKEAYFMHEKP